MLPPRLAFSARHEDSDSKAQDSNTLPMFVEPPKSHSRHGSVEGRHCYCTKNRSSGRFLQQASKSRTSSTPKACDEAGRTPSTLQRDLIHKILRKHNFSSSMKTYPAMSGSIDLLIVNDRHLAVAVGASTFSPAFFSTRHRCPASLESKWPGYGT